MSELKALAISIFDSAKVDIDDILEAAGVQAEELKQRAYVLGLNYTEVGLRQAAGADVTSELQALKVSAAALEAATSMIVVHGIVNAVQSTIRSIFFGLFKMIVL